MAGTDKSGADWAWGSGGNGGDNGRSDSGDCDDTVERACEDSLGDDVDGPATGGGALFTDGALFLICEFGLLLVGLLRGNERVSLSAESTWLRRGPSERYSLVMRVPEDERT